VKRPALLAVILLGALLQMWGLEYNKNLWIDEESTAYVSSQESVSAVAQKVIEAESRPPLYFLLVHGWMALAGESDLSLRFLSVACCLLSLALIFTLGRALGGEWLGLLAAYLLAVSPSFVLYGRMVRYYSLILLLGLLSCLFAWWAWHRGRLIHWLAYFVFSALLLYADYLSTALLLAQNLFLLLNLRRYRPILGRWVATQAGIGLAFVPWLPIVFFHGGRFGGVADLAHGLGYLLKVAYFFFSFSMGETIFPWHPAAIVGGPLLVGLAFLGGVSWVKDRSPGRLWTIVMLLVPAGFAIFVLSGWLLPSFSFVTLGSRTLFALPFFQLLVAFGVLRLRRARWMVAVLLLLTAARVFSLWNYYTDRQFHNPIYAVPIRELVRSIGDEYRAGDVIVCDPAVPFDYYHRREDYAETLFFIGGIRKLFTPGTQPEEIERYLREKEPPRVWIVSMERERTTDHNPMESLATVLAESYTLEGHTGYAEQDETYRRGKERLMKKSPYRYKVEVFLYVRVL
jgi:4-amino-4-deoxy-L-arabinose transferase-like glycosyltransferase